MANHDVWDAITQESGTPASSFEFLVDLYYNSTFNRFADVVNVNPAFEPKTRARQTYAAKGVDNALKYGSNLVVTFDYEAVRDANGLYQVELQDLIDASKLNGLSNVRRLRFYDALGADYAFDADFAIGVNRTNTDFDEAGFYTITATQYLFRGFITNPVLTGNVPLIVDVTPDSAAAAAHVWIQGEKFTGTTGATGVRFASTNATSYTVINDTLIDAVVPTMSNGSAPITVTSPVGVSEPFPFTKV